MSEDRSSTWSPILPPETAERALQVAEEIATGIRQTLAERREDPEVWSRQGPGLAGGDAGQAVFFTYLEPARPGLGCEDTAMELLERSIETTGTMQAPPSLYGGFAGVAWALEHLRGRLFEEEGEDPGADVAAALSEHVSLTPWMGHYDLISGLVGFGVYALERFPHPGGRECLERVVARLAETSEQQADGLTWLTGPNLLIDRDLETYANGYYNVGVAHGVPGVVGLLAKVREAGLDDRGMLEGAVSWVLSQRLPEGSSSVFPYSMAPGIEPKPTRLAWCYGDLGIAVTLLAAARAAGEAEWERAALDVARRAAARAAADSGVTDAGVCHGAAGVAHLFNRLYQATGDGACRDAALAWFERTLAMREEEGIGGFRAWSAVGTEGEMAWRDDPGFLTGSAGIGLCLLAGATPVEPEWDRMLLTDVP